MEVGETIMTQLILICIIFFIFSVFWGKHLHIDYKSFFKEGFKKLDNKFGIYCYTGKQGTGKTYSAVKFNKEQMASEGYKTITNIKSLAFRNGGVTLREFKKLEDTTKVNYIYEPDIFEIIKFCKGFKENDKNIMIFFDEIFTCLEKSGALQKEILSFLSQLRKRKILFITTAQEWSEINITFRRYVRFQISCSMIALPFFKYAFINNQINDGDLIKWDNDSQDFIAPTIQTNFSKGLKSIINAYDTFETIDSKSTMNKQRR